MVTDLKQRALQAAKAIGLFRLSRWLTRDRLRILCYHGIWLDQTTPNPFNFLYMQPERFARRMALLHSLGYPVLSLDEALRRLDDNTLPANAVVITIDDGWYGSFVHMVPTLLDHGFPATLYLTTHHAEKKTAVFGVALQYILQVSPRRQLDCAELALPCKGMVNLDDPVQRDQLHAAVCDLSERRRDREQPEQLLETVANALGLDWKRVASGRFFHLMSLDEARECAEAGIDFQLHTHRHRITHDGDVCLLMELEDNRARLVHVTPAPTVHFCYPSGNWDPAYFEQLERAGVVSATTTDNGMCEKITPRLALPRLMDGDRVTDIEFEAELCGMMEIRRKLTRR